MKHTKEPWKVSGRADNIRAAFSDKYGSWDGAVAVVCQDIEEYEANARRIITCVNACSNISNEALQAGFIEKLIAATQNLYINALDREEAEDDDGEECSDWGALREALALVDDKYAIYY